MCEMFRLQPTAQRKVFCQRSQDLLQRRLLPVSLKSRILPTLSPSLSCLDTPFSSSSHKMTNYRVWKWHLPSQCSKSWNVFVVFPSFWWVRRRPLEFLSRGSTCFAVSRGWRQRWPLVAAGGKYSGRHGGWRAAADGGLKDSWFSSEGLRSKAQEEINRNAFKIRESCLETGFKKANSRWVWVVDS